MLAHSAIHPRLKQLRPVVSRGIDAPRYHGIQPRRYNRTVSTTPDIALDPLRQRPSCARSKIAARAWQRHGSLFRRGRLGLFCGNGPSCFRRPDAGGARRLAKPRPPRYGAGQGIRRTQGIPLRVIQTEELDKPEYQRNDANRCFHCKTELFEGMKKLGADSALPRSPTA